MRVLFLISLLFALLALAAAHKHQVSSEAGSEADVKV